jgi:hypothetical protein
MNSGELNNIGFITHSAIDLENNRPFISCTGFMSKKPPELNVFPVRVPKSCLTLIINTVKN